MFDVSTITEALLTICVVVALRLIQPWIKANATLKQQESINKIMDTLVGAAEQVIGPGNGKSKMEHVLDWAQEQDVDASVADIEAAVYRMKKSGKSGKGCVESAGEDASEAEAEFEIEGEVETKTEVETDPKDR
ncbi:hypothetical protein FACS1894184_00580 [Clostridia bacterium]|nr:hypothetical protein FACS1894184_00580 [Clostridia bacterium]